MAPSTTLLTGLRPAFAGLCGPVLLAGLLANAPGGPGPARPTPAPGADHQPRGDCDAVRFVLLLVPTAPELAATTPPTRPPRSAPSTWPWSGPARPPAPMGESVRELRENTRLTLGSFVLRTGPPACHTAAFVASSLCTLLACSNCAVSPVLCFCLCRPFPKA